MAGKLNLTVREVQSSNRRRVRVVANDELRGEVELFLPEQAARFLVASLAEDIIRWNEEDEAKGNGHE